MENGIIAQTPIDPTVGLAVSCLLGLAAIAVAINSVWKLIDRFTGKKLTQPLEVRPATEYVKKDDCIARTQRTVDEISRIDRDLKALREERSADIKAAAASRHGIYDKIEEVRSEMNTGFKDMERAIGRIEGKISKDA